MKPKDKLTLFYESYLKENEELFNNDVFAKNMYSALLAGDSEVYQKNVSQTKIFDEKWIETLESYLPSIDKIMRNPKSDLKYEEEVVLIEKAKKTDARSIKHLSSNTHLIKEVTDEMIRPKKILTTFSDVNYATYENRMVYSLVERLFYFVRSRSEVIKEEIASFQNKTLHFNSEFPFNEALLTFDLKLNIKEEPDNKEINKYNEALLIRVEALEKLVSGFMHANLMKDLKGVPKVRTPLMKTSIILKNPDYHNCYLLWLFLDRYNTLAFETEIKEKIMELDESYLESVYQDIVISLSSVLYHQERRKLLYNTFDKVSKKKSVKVLKDLEVQNFLEEDVEITDENINQYYLEQNLKLFEQSLEYHKETSSTYEVALKKALRETIEFSNKIYETFFKFQEDDDIFRRLITKLDPKEEIKEIREMVLVAKTIREVKSVDYRKSLNLENKLLSRLLSLNKELTHNQELLLKGVIEREKTEYLLRLEEEETLLTTNLVKEEINFTKLEEDRLNKAKQDVDEMFKDLDINYNRRLREDLLALTRNLNKAHADKMKEISNKHYAKLRLLKREKELEIKMLHNKLAEKKQLLDEAYKEEELLKKAELRALHLKETTKQQSTFKLEEDDLLSGLDKEIERLKYLINNSKKELKEVGVRLSTQRSNVYLNETGLPLKIDEDLKDNDLSDVIVEKAKQKPVIKRQTYVRGVLRSR